MSKASLGNSLQIVFVIQAGELTLKALLLGFSLRRLLGAHVRLIAACPQYSDWGDLPSATLKLLRQLDIELRPFTPTFAPEYPIGNKIDAMGLLDDSGPAVFMDSDILCLRSFTAEQLLPAAADAPLALAAKPADLSTWGSEQQWQLLREGLKLGDTRLRVRCTVDGQLNRPYYNAGVLATNQPQQLSQLWRKICQDIAQLQPLPEPIYPWLDQIGMAVCAQYHVQRRISLDEHWNFPAHLRALPSKDGPALCHYHSPGVILREPQLLALVRKAASKYAHIAQLMRSFAQWQPLLRARLPQLRNKNLKGCDFLITGIPRSGTSLLCKLLSQQPNWLVLNEPAQVIPQLSSRPDASGIALLHRQYRQRILLGEQIDNKIRDGQMVEDTAENDERTLYHPEVRGRFFRMGSKNTLAYLASLDALQQQGWPIVAMIRNPLDSLASWSTTFDHLRQAQPELLPLTHANHYGWAGWQRAALAEMAGQADPTVRRVLLWRMLARTLLSQPQVLLWRYEDLVANPREHIARLRKQLGARGSGPKLEYLSARKHDHADNPHLELLGDLCQPELHQLGYLL